MTQRPLLRGLYSALDLVYESESDSVSIRILPAMVAATHPLPLSVAAPKQARSERTLHRLLDTAEALVVERGLAGLSIPEVARRAGSSVGGFYARLRDKNELLRALEERFFQEVSARLEALADERRWRESGIAAGRCHALHAASTANSPAASLGGRGSFQWAMPPPHLASYVAGP
jgi:AcrR family transcriptional regulator